MSYHRGMATAASATKRSSQQLKTLDAADASRLARLAYRVILDDEIDKAKVLDQLKSITAKQVGKAVLGSTRVDADAIEFAEKLKSWARKNAKVVAVPEVE